MNLDHSNNFYRFRCPVVAQDKYRTGCSKVISKHNSGDLNVRHECSRAIDCKECPALRMAMEEFGWGTKYYVDRDDAGSGVMSRAECGLPERTQAEVEHHHKLLDTLGLKPVERKVATTYVAKQRQNAAEKPVQTFVSADLATHINQAVASMGAA